MACCGEEDPPKNEGRALLHESGGQGYQTAPDMTYSVGGKDAKGLVVKEQAPKQRIREADLPPDTTLQCKRCRKIYKVEDNGPEQCRYHNGRFVKGSTAPMSSTKWTCCKSYTRTEPGCKAAPGWCPPAHHVIARRTPRGRLLLERSSLTERCAGCVIAAGRRSNRLHHQLGWLVLHSGRCSLAGIEQIGARYAARLPQKARRIATCIISTSLDSPEPRLSLNKMTKPTFSYFPIRGRGFVGRALLHIAGVDFNDNRVPLNEWDSLKATTPFGHVPVYQDDDVGFLTESGTIYRYLARKHGLAGATPLEQVQVDEVFEIYYDIFRAAQKAYFGSDAGGETVVRESEARSRQEFLENNVPEYVDLTRRLLARNGNTGFLVGDSLTLADVQAFHVINNWLRPLSPQAIAPVQPYLDRVRQANGRLNSYLTTGGVAPTTEPSIFTFLNTPSLFKGEFEG